MAIDRFFAQALVKARQQQAAIDAEKKAKQEAPIELKTLNGSKPQSSSNNPGATVGASVPPNASVRPKQ